MRPAVGIVVLPMIIAGSGGLTACSGGSDDTAPRRTDATAEPTTTTISSAQRICSGELDAPVQVGTLEDPALVEVSGVVASRSQPGVLWVHNDSGDSARIFAIDRQGRRLGEFTISGVAAEDWEDIAIVAGNDGARDTIVVADFGDFNGARPTVDLVFVPEPTIPVDPAAPVAVDDASTVAYRYDDGPHEAETLLADPRSGVMYVVTKEFVDAPQVFRVGAAPAAGSTDPGVFERIGELDLGPARLVTGGDVSPDGSAIALRTYTDVFVFSRDGDDLGAAFAGEPCAAVAPRERQGEAIAFLANGSGYITIGEDPGAPVWEVAIP